MTSLCPGPLFQTSGLNQNSTPTAPTATPSEIDRKLLRGPFNGRDWPRDSPVARVYDVANTSTSLVLLNRRRKNKSQLRGLTRRNAEIVAPEPQRHVPDEPSVNWQHHKKCLHSSSEPYRPNINLDLGWVNTTQRPPVRFDSGSHVNHRRHTSCRVSGDSPVVGWTGIGRRPLTSTSNGVDTELQSMSPILNDPDISHGGRRYLYSIARIYSTSQMKQLKQDQYHQLLFKELNKGYHSPKEYERYLSYLNMPRKTQFGKLDNYEEFRRSKSAPPPAQSDSSGRGGESDKGSKKQKRPQFSSHSWAPSMISSRPSTRQKGGKKKKRGASPSQSPRPTDDSHSREQQSPEPPGTTLTSEEDPSDHTRKEESEAGDEPLEGIKESEEDSYKSKDKASKSETATKETESTRIPFTTTNKDDDGVSPRKGNEGVTPRKDVLSPRKGEETDTPRKGNETDGRLLSGRDGQSSEGASTTRGPGSSNATSNNFLALIVSDAEKDDDSKVGDGNEKQSSAEDTTTSQPAEAGRDFNDMHMATGYTPRKNKEGRTRPLSRAGRGFEERKDHTHRENSDDDYDDTDEETEKTDTVTDKKDSSPPQQQQKEAPVQQSALEPETAAVDTSRTDDSKAEERGEIEEEPTKAADSDKRAPTPEEGNDERAQDSREVEGQRSIMIPVNERAEDTSAAKENVMDLSAESKNRDVDKLEY